MKIIVISILLLIVNQLQAQWISTYGLGGVRITSLSAIGSNIYAATDSGVYVSNNNGSNWVSAADNVLGKIWVLSLASDDTKIVAGAYGIKYKYNNSSNWYNTNPVDIGFIETMYYHYNSIIVNGNKIIAGVGGGVNNFGFSKVFISENNGVSWRNASTGLPGISHYYYPQTYLALNGINFFAGTHLGVYYSSNDGILWTKKSEGLPINRQVTSIAIDDTIVFAGISYSGMYLSRNNGLSWVSISDGLPTNTNVNAIVFFGNNIFLGTDHGVFVSNKNEISWKYASNGLPANVYTSSLVVNGENLYVGTQNNGVWKRPLIEMVSISNEESKLKTVTLCSNYPNPFNPITTISYGLKNTCQTKLTVYNAKGELVQTLIQGVQAAGAHSVVFDGSKVNSGVYFYKLEADGKVMSNKMLLVK